MRFDLLSRSSWTDSRAESTDSIAVSRDETWVESEDCSAAEHETELLTVEISIEMVYREVLEVDDSEMVITEIQFV